MTKGKEKIETVMGYKIPPPRTTTWGLLRIGQYVLLPLFSFLFALDVIFFLIARFGMNTCYGVLCFFE